ncbi:ubiquitin carboxyl-terminal hydrolase isozyme L3-like [Hydractinia symbiolongicarpus]|uniref:ubiquitin carboxyl-terminal hydrolase isozyme L3-like n=1 Tax=Hydractinia symbiolongicarpus TaxID=13093 RepID=UPI0025507E08|nr:ubiquitin carboxyl-terminal hydrolase isozyme L3-like [Hydractinia symbiolongicarpus]
MPGPRWLPLESNPDVMNAYMNKLGVDTNQWKYFDVYGTDPELLMMVPQPVCSLLLLFPITENYEKFCREQEKNMKKEDKNISKDVYFTKQTVGNACGTVGIIHSIANNLDVITLKNGCLKSFIEKSKLVSPIEKAKLLESDEGIAQCHGDSALEGQTKAPSADEKVNLHFIALVHKDGKLYELDGRRDFPVSHGPTNAASFFQDAAVVCKKFMERDPTLLQFNMIALANAQ